METSGKGGLASPPPSVRYVTVALERARLSLTLALTLTATAVIAHAGYRFHSVVQPSLYGFTSIFAIAVLGHLVAQRRAGALQECPLHLIE